MRGLANVLGAAILRMDVETALRETTHELEALIDASPLPVVAYPAGRVTLWNPTAEQVLRMDGGGSDRKDLPFVQPEMLDEFHSVRERALAGHRSWPSRRSASQGTGC